MGQVTLANDVVYFEMMQCLVPIALHDLQLYGSCSTKLLLCPQLYKTVICPLCLLSFVLCCVIDTK